MRDQRADAAEGDYTQEEVRILKEALRTVTGTARISFTADQVVDWLSRARS